MEIEMTAATCKGSGRGAAIRWESPHQTVIPPYGEMVREFGSGRMIPSPGGMPTNGECFYCHQWIALTDKGKLVEHDRRA